MKMSVVASSLCLLGAIASGRVSASEFVIVDKLEQAVAERAILPSAHDSVSGANFAELGSVFDSIIAANEIGRAHV